MLTLSQRVEIFLYVEPANRGRIPAIDPQPGLPRLFLTGLHAYWVSSV